MKRILFVLILLLNVLLIQKSNAEVRLPKIVSSNMVLQRDATVALWGWADPNEKIEIKTSWLDKELKLEADDQGNWKIEVKTTLSKERQTIRIKSASSDINLENILFGEVWLCSGQSNMQQPLNGYKGQPTFGSQLAIAKSSNPNLRLFTVERIGSIIPLDDVEKASGWQMAGPENVYDFSSVGYFFASQLQEILNVPVGVIHTSWSGSIVEAWVSKEVLSKYEDTPSESVDLEKRTQKTPIVLFNSMINPLTSFTIKGVLWYQGESNRKDPAKYKNVFPAMVKDWRNRWGIGDFPFYYVQIAPFIYEGNTNFQNVENSAFIRETQLQCLDLIPNSAMVVTLDVGDSACIHPPKKKEVADRLLLNALSQTYDIKGLDHAGPTFASQEISDGSIFLEFDHAETGLFSYGSLAGFEIAGADQVFYPAQAVIIDRMKVLVKSDQVPDPKAVRYGWSNWVEGTLFDTNLLPASSFRTDDWEEATRVSD